MCLELNLFSLVPLLLNKISTNEREASINHFLAQTSVEQVAWRLQRDDVKRCCLSVLSGSQTDENAESTVWSAWTVENLYVGSLLPTCRITLCY